MDSSLQYLTECASMLYLNDDAIRDVMMKKKM